jgi:hypothetical protein
LGRWKLYRSYRAKIVAELSEAERHYVDIPFETTSLPVGEGREEPLSRCVGEQLNRRTVLIVSEAGRGKTSVCELIAHRLAKGELRIGNSRREPVIIRGTGFGGDLLKSVTSELSFRGAWTSEAIAKRQIEGKRLMLIFDGLSEMDQNQLDSLATSLKSLGKQTCLAVSRSEPPAALAAALGDAIHVRLMDLSGEVEERFYTAYAGTPEKARRLQEEIGRRYPTLPRTPLFMKIASTVYKESGQIPTNLGALFDLYITDLIGRAKTKSADPDGLLFAIRQLTKETFLEKHGEKRGFSEQKGIEVLGKAVDELNFRDVTVSPLGILNLLSRAGIYLRNRHYFTAAHDLLEDYFAALVFDYEWDNDGTEIVLAFKSNPNLSEAWEFFKQIRPEIATFQIPSIMQTSSSAHPIAGKDMA